MPPILGAEILPKTLKDEVNWIASYLSHFKHFRYVRRFWTAREKSHYNFFKAVYSNPNNAWLGIVLLKNSGLQGVRIWKKKGLYNIHDVLPWIYI